MGPTWRRAIVVGASSGIGAAIARQLACEGTIVAIVARRAERLELLADSISAAGSISKPLVYPCDVRDVDASRNLFAEIVRDLEGLDLIVYSSGVMPRGAHTGFPTDEDVAAIETNFTGAVVWLNAAAEYFQVQGHGTIAGIGSVAGDRGRGGNPIYNASKAALATYLEALRNRLAGKGVTVVTIKPGFIRTDMIGSRRVFPPASGVDDAARLILAAARAGKRVAYVPPWWRWIALLLKAMPSVVMERLPV
jgi:short-subunit dehydrogenase